MRIRSVNTTRSGLGVFFVASTLLLAVFALGCSSQIPTATDTTGTTLKGRVVDEQHPVSGASVLVMTGSGHDVVTTTDSAGEFAADLPAGEQATSVAVASLQKTGFLEDLAGDHITVSIATGEPASPTVSGASGLSPQGYLTFGVYDTDSHGDVRFRYQYGFRYYTCVNWLPSWLGQNPNPNSWDGWDLTNFPAPWKGKKLLVPTRLRWFHAAYYGFSIDRSLYLIAWR